MLKGFIFDLDGVITDTATYHFKAWQALAVDLGIEIDGAFNEQLKGIDRMTSLEMILAKGHQENQFTLEEKKELAAKKNTHYLALLQDLGPGDLLPGVLAFVKEAKKLGIPSGVASASKNAPFILKQLGVAEYFSVVVDPESVEKGKPAPDIFLKGLELLDISPEEAIGFEDAQAGVTALNKAKILAIGIEDEKKLEGTAFSIPNFSEVTVDELIKLKQ